jgi:hypothetical protein
MDSISKSFFPLLVVIIVASSMMISQPATAEVEIVSTSCGIFVDNIVEGEPITFTVQLYPAPPIGEVFSNLSVGIVSPQQGISGWGPWDQKNIITDSNGMAKITFNIPTFGSQANWNVWVYFGGQHFGNNTLYYQSGHWERNFFVSSAKTPTLTPLPSETSTPTPTSSITTSPTLTIAPSLPPEGRNAPHLEPTFYLLPIVIVAIIVISIIIYRRRFASKQSLL